MRQENDNRPGSWDRLKKTISWSGLSTNAFAQTIGLKRAENLYQIKKGNYSISKELAEKIATKYSNISKSWLLTGEGKMFTDDNVVTNRIPYFDTGLDSINSIELSAKPIHYLDIPVLPNCDIAILHTSDAMKPDIPTGSIVILKEIDPPSLLSGEIYLIVTENYNTIRSVRVVDDNPDFLRLIPKNLDQFDETVIEKNSIKRLFIVRGVISTRSL